MMVICEGVGVAVGVGDAVGVGVGDGVGVGVAVYFIKKSSADQPSTPVS